MEDELEYGSRFNPEAVKFQYDFLSEIGLDGLPEEAEGLKKVIGEKRKLLFLVNPPYGTCGNGRTGGGGKRKMGIADTVVKESMDLGSSRQQLYAQFMFKMARLGGIVAQFSPTLFLTGVSYKKFRKYWLGKYRMSEGMLFQASEFADVNGEWGIMFSIWDRMSSFISEWEVSLKRSSGGLVETFDKKVIYNLDNGFSCGDWVREGVKGRKTYDTPQLTSAIVVRQDGKGRVVKEAIGYSSNERNSIYVNRTGVVLLSGGYRHGDGLSVAEVNFRRCCALFAARKTIMGNYATWINQKDEYIAPNEFHPDYEQWNNDSIVYSIFNNSSHQSSLRNVKYKNKIWQIKNEWFWMSRQEMLDLADKYDNEDVYNDSRKDEDRFVYKELQVLKLSPDVQVVLDKAIELVRKTFGLREMVNYEHSEWNICTWDAGWYQMKKLLKGYMPQELKEFQVLYKEFEDRMREGVYEFGFLRR